jgi:exodeoxyribonuclease VII small subunit
MPKKTTKNTLNFESSLKELEELVESMEQGDLSLEDSLKHFERGIALTRSCQTALKEAEQKVQILMEQNSKLETEPFENKE